jgi:ATP-dependent protease ClpP protease subunit
LIHIAFLHSSPGYCFDRRISNLVAKKRLLLHTNAAISTLGGGHFMCGHLNQAMTMARRQLAVARALGDEMLFARVYMHYVYINLHGGHLDDALCIAIRLQRLGKATRDTELHGMAHAAAVLIRRLLVVDAAALLPAATHSANASDGAVTAKVSDDFARYRSALTQRRALGKGPRVL